MMMRLGSRKQVCKGSKSLNGGEVMTLEDIGCGDGGIGNPFQQLLLRLYQFGWRHDRQPLHEGRIAGNILVVPRKDGLGCGPLKDFRWLLSPEHEELDRFSRLKNLDGPSDDVLFIDPSDQGIARIQTVWVRR